MRGGERGVSLQSNQDMISIRGRGGRKRDKRRGAAAEMEEIKLERRVRCRTDMWRRANAKKKKKNTQQRNNGGAGADGGGDDKVFT